MLDYQKKFINFLLQSQVLLFGEFVTKSGRETPYFINTGRFDSGAKVMALSKFYAEHIVTNSLDEIDAIFGPAYKGIPLAVATAVGLHQLTGRDFGFSFDRKEKKLHGDKGSIVGHSLQPKERVLLVEDVVTAGTTLRDTIPKLRDNFAADITSAVVAVDRCERGSGTLAATKEIEEELAVKVVPIITIYDIINFLQKGSPLKNAAEIADRIKHYLNKYGA